MANELTDVELEEMKVLLVFDLFVIVQHGKIKRNRTV